MWIFVNALIENPAFDSQTKEALTLKSSAFGSKCDLSEDFVKKGYLLCLGSGARRLTDEQLPSLALWITCSAGRGSNRIRFSRSLMALSGPGELE